MQVKRKTCVTSFFFSFFFAETKSNLTFSYSRNVQIYVLLIEMFVYVVLCAVLYVIITVLIADANWTRFCNPTPSDQLTKY